MIAKDDIKREIDASALRNECVFINRSDLAPGAEEFLEGLSDGDCDAFEWHEYWGEEDGEMTWRIHVRA